MSAGSVIKRSLAALLVALAVGASGQTKIDLPTQTKGVLPAANGGAGTVSGALKANGSGTVSQAACSDLSNGATGCSTATGTAGATIPLNNGSNTFSGTNTFSNSIIGNITGNAATVTTNANLTGPITSSGNATAVGAQTGTGSTFVMQSTPTINTPTFVAPALGTPSSGVATNLTGTASGLTAGNVTTNANLTGPITSTGNATAVAAQTGTGSTFVMQSSPTINTPTFTAAILGTPQSGTLTNATGLPISSGVSGLGTGVATFLATPSSANLASAITDETGTGSVVFASTPTLNTPTISGAFTLPGSSSGTVTVKPAAAAGTWTMTLPTSGGTSTYVLTTDGTGVTSWAAAASAVVGSDKQIAFNKSGTESGSANLLFDDTLKKLTVTGSSNGGSVTFQVSPGTGSSSIKATDNGTLTIDGDSGTATTPLTVKSGGATQFSVNFAGTVTLNSINVASGFMSLLKSGSNGQISAFNVLELATGNGGTGTKAQVNSGTLNTLRDLEARGVITGPVTVASLQTCNSGNKGMRQFVTDATASTFASIVAGTGSTNIPVYCDGTDWRIG